MILANGNWYTTKKYLSRTDNQGEETRLVGRDERPRRIFSEEGERGIALFC
jgi:hypothetical protein